MIALRPIYGGPIGTTPVNPPPSHQYIQTAESFRSLCGRLRDTSRFALDTEFVGEDSFVARLELIQVAAEDLVAVVDVPAVGSLDCFADLLRDRRIEKVVHAGQQDLELFHIHAGEVPVPIFDTQVAAAMVGYGTQVGYAQLVQRVLGTKLAKSHTLTNWTQRPLTQEQITYASEDVRFLLPVYEHLLHRLRQLDRLEWIKEEFLRLEARPTDQSRDPRHRFRRIRGWDSLKPKAAAVLRELAAWREGEAQRRNVPRNRIVREEILIELARHAPRTIAALRNTRGLHHSEVDRNGEVLLEVIRAAVALPPDEWPDIPQAKRPQPEAAGVVDLLQAVLKSRAKEIEIAPSLLANASDLQALAEAKQGRDRLDLPILHGWRRKLAGDLLLSVLDGSCTVQVDPASGALRLTAIPGNP